ncbi:MULTISPECIES: 4Fe-4S single cluster domain-containing protein [Providencia]|uniref:4Fe-4S single cluster domain-containing protein n=1 Tax=Providencia TaxID=586 RepID=UPI00197F2254|nr:MULTISPECIES: 4Fe-4S single cluster domain-containing protein [Providencia]HEC8330662.1 radical SAM protein [Providencia rettgeri]MBN4865292.1 radical SAM protein [Providencia stuartii]MBN4874482.1 radical SAM protein [Providencia stuartii]MBN4879305.1 radical SAM protein [Providencia stuartii]MBN4883683.1 radical SAM protein [Providencia stuartii]
MNISVSRIHFPVTTLGPGKRIGIWFQGCSLRCKGCLSPDTWHVKESYLTVAKLINQIVEWYPVADGITISGGEPFEQPDALFELIREIKQRFQGDILVYSGYEWDVIEDRVKRMNPYIDALISEPFKVEIPQTLMLRGSDNQQLHLLTPLGKTLFKQYQRVITPEDKKLDLAFDEQGRLFLAGIPERDDMSRLSQLLALQDNTLKQLKK